jgi:L-cysteine/cystine lyase
MADVKMADLKIEDLAACRAVMPALSNKGYFNFGGQGTMPQSTLDRIMESYEHVQKVGPFSMPMFKWICNELQLTREAIAGELGGKPDCWALTGNVTEGCNIVMWGLDWQPGDRMLLTDSEHDGALNAAANIAQRLGVELDYFPVMQKSEEEILTGLEAALTDRTKLVVYSHVLWNTGQLLPMEKMAERVATHGAQSLVDGAQSAGAIPLDLGKSKVDYYAITGHKWMCGPDGLGALYIREDRLSELKPTYTGWRLNMTAQPGKVDGSRFEVATSAFPLLSGLRNSIEFHKSRSTTEQRAHLIRKNAALLRSKLGSIPHVHCLGDETPMSGLVSFTVDGANHEKIVVDLDGLGFIVRTILIPDSIRASVHYYTSEDEILRLTAALNSLL